MPRRVEDILPSDHRSIRDIPIDHGKSRTAALRPSVEKRSTKMRDEVAVKVRKVEEREERAEKASNETMRKMTMTPPSPKKKSFARKSMWFMITSGTFVVIIVAAFIASTYFSRAVFTITPKVAEVKVNNSLVVKSGNATNVGDLTYEVISMKDSQSVVVQATEGAVVSTKAEGSVILYNAYSMSSVRLIAGTRLANDSGLVYRLKSSVVIPAYTKPSGSVVAGSVKVGIIADQPGAQYNISRSDSISDFKIVAYKGTDKYDYIYARLTSDVVGGAVGAKKIVNATVLASSTATLKAGITSSLLQQIKGSVPDGYIMYDSGYTSIFSTPVVGGTDKNQATITVQGTVYGIIFKESNLVSKLAGPEAVSAFGNIGYSVPQLRELAFNISNIKDFAPDKKGTLIINVKGDMKLIGTIPVQKLKEDLAGKSLSDSQEVLKKYSPVIEKADGELVPPWSKIPTDVDRITINIEE